MRAPLSPGCFRPKGCTFVFNIIILLSLCWNALSLMQYYSRASQAPPPNMTTAPAALRCSAEPQAQCVAAAGRHMHGAGLQQGGACAVRGCVGEAHALCVAAARKEAQAQRAAVTVRHALRCVQPPAPATQEDASSTDPVIPEPAQPVGLPAGMGPLVTVPETPAPPAQPLPSEHRGPAQLPKPGVVPPSPPGAQPPTCAAKAVWCARQTPFGICCQNCVVCTAKAMWLPKLCGEWPRQFVC